MISRYSKIQRFLSFSLIIILLLSSTVKIPFFSFLGYIALAGDENRYNIVSIFVNEDVYKNGNIKNNINIYSKNIQKTLKQTKVLVFPTPGDINPYNIASLNEKLYFEGYEGLDGMKGESKLIGTILIGDLPLAIVHSGNNSDKTILVYTDFVDKSFIYDEDSGKYLTNPNSDNNHKAEIWHGVISPNTGNTSNDINKISDYLKKNSNFYNKQGVFQDIDFEEPNIFYFDSIREEKAISYNNYEAYNKSLEYLEDLAYNRFTSKLADKLSSAFNDSASDGIKDSLSDIAPGLDLSDFTNKPDLSSAPDVQSRYAIKKSLKKFVEIFNASILGGFKEDVHNAGRYNGTGKDVNVDISPSIISNMDEFSKAVMKSANNDLESYIDNLVKTNISQDIPVLTRIERKNNQKVGKYYDIEFKNYFSGLEGKNVNSAEDCSIFRGSLATESNRSQIVEASRAFDLSNSAGIRQDISYLTKYLSLKKTYQDKSFPDPKMCFDSNNKAYTSHLWGGNTLTNLNTQVDSSDPFVSNSLSVKAESDAEKSKEEEIKMLEEEIEGNQEEINELNEDLDKLKIKYDELNEIEEKISDYNSKISYIDSKGGSCYMGKENYNGDDLYCDNSGNDSVCDNDNSCSGNNFFRYNRECCNTSKDDLISYRDTEINNRDEKIEEIKLIAKICDEETGEICDGYPTSTGRTIDGLEEIILSYENEIDNIEQEIINIENGVENVDNSESQSNYDIQSNPYNLYEDNKYRNFILPAFNINGAKALPYDTDKTQEIPSDISFQKGTTYSPMDCLKNDIIINTYKYDTSTGWSGWAVKKTREKRKIDYLLYKTNCDKGDYEKVVDVSYHQKRRKRFRKATRYKVKYDYSCEYINDSCLAPVKNTRPSSEFLYGNFTFKDKYKNIGNDAIILEDIVLDGLSYKKDPNTGYMLKGNSEYTIKGTKNDSKSGWNMYYKRIASYIMHKSPTNGELSSQVKAMSSPNLPIDADRYVDFLGIDGNYQRIDYPRLFRIKLDPGVNPSYEKIDQLLKDYLDDKSKILNNKIYNLKLSLVNSSQVDKEIYRLFGVLGTHELYNPSSVTKTDINLYNYLKNKPGATLSFKNSTKTISYLDTLILSIYWNNYNSIPAKYKFIFEQYLSDSYNKSGDKFYVPNNKRSYEIAYLGANGDAQNMYVKIDPESKGEGPYNDIINNNLELNNSITGLKVSKAKNKYQNKNENSGSNVQCGPPDGVAIWKWPSAVSCRLKTLFPAKIGISDGSCGVSMLKGEDLGFDLEADECRDDLNRNGINDCIEKIKDGEIELNSYNNKFYYNESLLLSAKLKDSDGNIIKQDSKTRVYFDLVKAVVPRNPDELFNEVNSKIIYDKYSSLDNLKDREAKSKATSFVRKTSFNSKSSFGESEAIFSLKNKDANLYFEARIEIKDNTGDIFISKKSNRIGIMLRGDRLILKGYNINTSEDGVKNIDSKSSSVLVSDQTNIFLFDETKGNIKSQIFSSSSKEKFVLSANNISKSGNRLSINYPLNIKFYKDSELLDEKTINNLNSPLDLYAIKKSGIYKIDIIDSLGSKASKEIEIIAEIADKNNSSINLSTNVIQSGNVFTTHIISLKDKFGNLVVGDLYNVDLSIDADKGLSFDDNNFSKKLQVFEGYKDFKLVSSDKEFANHKIKYQVKNQIGDIIFEGESEKISTKKIIKLSIDFVTDTSKIKVGGNKVEYELLVKDKSGNKLSGFNSRGYMNISDIYGRSLDSFIDIIDGRGYGIFETSTVASQNTSMSFSIEGLKNNFSKNFIIYPEKALKIDLTLSKVKLEASPSSKSILTVELKDVFGNLVFNDNSTKLELSIPDKYLSILSVSGSSNKKVSKGKTSFILSASDFPGRAYFKVSSSNKNLKDNYYDLVGQGKISKNSLNSYSWIRSGGILTSIGSKFYFEYDEDNYISKFSSLEDLKKSSDYKNLNTSRKSQIVNLWNSNNKIRINGVGENAGMIDTYYFWNKKAIDKSDYNSFYTVLLGSNYGDITEKDYLASSLLFDTSNKSIAVSSLLNNPLKYNDLISLSPDGSLSTFELEDLSQDISISFGIEKNKIFASLYNNALATYIGKIYYLLDSSNINIIECLDDNNNLGVSSCLGEKASYTNIKYKLYDNSIKNINKSSDNLLFHDENDNLVLKINSNGDISKGSFISLELDKENILDNGLNLKIIKSGKNIGYLNISLDDSELKVERNINNLNNILNSENNKIISFLETKLYGSRSVYLGKSTKDKKGLRIWYNDPFNTNETLNPLYTSKSGAFEKFSKEKGLGWGGANKTFLNLSSGMPLGEAILPYTSFSLINLGDPVFKLKDQRKNLPGKNLKRNFDSSIGKLIDNSDDNISYGVLDYNNDSRDDIVIFKNEGYIKLYENTNTSKEFLDRGNIIKLSDINNKSIVKTGDFSGDGYGDIFVVNQDGKPVLINNYKKDFYRIDLTTEFLLQGKINRLETFDMDNDGKTDVIILNDKGQIFIYYGGGDAKKPSFTKKIIASGFGVKLSNKDRKEAGAIYFKGLYQSPKDKQASFMENSENLLKDVESKLNDMKSDPDNASPKSTKGSINESLLDNMIFYEFNYDPDSDYDGNTSQEENKQAIINSIGKSINFPNSEISGEIGSSVSDIKDFVSGVSSLNPSMDAKYDYPTNTNKITTFLKSEYAETQGIKISKRFIDKTGGFLDSSDKIEVIIVLENTSTSVKEDIAYMDGVPKPFLIGDDFSLDIESSKYGKKDLVIKSPAGGDFDFMVDNFDLEVGEKLTIKYNLETIPFKFGYIQVGLFEDGEVGDDDFGDIIFKNSSQNCAQSSSIFRSTSSRNYQKGVKTPSCDASKTKLPEEIEKMQDKNGDGLPDSLEGYIGKQDPSSIDMSSFQNFATEGLDNLNKDSDGDGIPDSEDDSPNYNEDSGGGLMGNLENLDKNAEKISEAVDTIVAGLGCGFGGGSCISSPLNWAPLAPGNDPTLFGMPIMDLLHPYEGLPIFSFMTYGPINIFGVPVPPFWPSNFIGAGGRFGASTGPIRIFVTPTITGALGTAICFGDNTAGGFLPPPGISPLIPGGNCIVAAMPFFGCSGDGSDGDPESIGESIAGGGNFGIVNGNCKGNNGSNESKTPYIPGNTVKKYIDYKKDYLNKIKNGSDTSNLVSNDLEKDIKNVFKKVAEPGSKWQIPSNEPLVSINPGDNSGMEVNLELDFQALSNFNFSDVVKIDLKRVNAFPDFIMSWVTRQIEEIVNKLTDFPTVFVILPDMSGLINYNYSDISTKIGENYEKGKSDRLKKEDRIQSNIDNLKERKSNLECDGTDKIACLELDVRIENLESEKGFLPKQTMSGIRSAFEFMSNLPLVSIQAEKVNVYIPWPDPAIVEKFLIDWELTKNQWTQELEEKRQMWSYGLSGCDELTNQKAIEKCRENFSVNMNILVDLETMISAIEQNIDILEEYKRFPEKINKLIRKKEDRLEQVLCNINIITEIVSGWIGRNGEIFKTWVELYLIIKAILSSWQLIIDVFVSFEEECHECKNERYDLLYFIFKLISMVIPDIPIIQFPKWPDIIIDLHDIRAGIIVGVPDFEFDIRPIVLPTLPKLYLPENPTISLHANLRGNIPVIPILPKIELPELPDLPTLPRIILPDLPPAPKLPRILGSIEGILKILKLVAKMLCILKINPFVPEWRAGDQIAYITERGGYLPIDFLDLSLPQFSYPFIDAIKVSTYVNLELETDFLTEFARQAVSPINTMTSNFVNSTRIAIPDLDFKKYSIDNVNIYLDGSVDADGFKLNYDYTDTYKNYALFIASSIYKLLDTLDSGSKELVSVSEFKNEIKNELSNMPSYENNKDISSIRNIWDKTLNYNFSKEDKIIKKLIDNNNSKFDTLKDIINTEIEYSKKQREDIENKLKNPNFSNKLINEIKSNSRFESYNNTLRKHNLESLKSLENLSKTDYKDSLEVSKNNLLAKLDNTIKGSDNRSKSCLATVSPGAAGGANSSCETGKAGTYSYEGLYVNEKHESETISYRLFDYLSWLDGDEEVKSIDYDKDSDIDLLYQVGNEIYLKTNYNKSSVKKFVTSNPKVIKKSDNPYFNNSIFYPAINGFEESISDNNFINLNFSQASNKDLSNFRIEFYNIIDKFSHLQNKKSSYIPEKTNSHVIDSFRDIDDNTLIEKTNSFTLRKNLVYFDYISNSIKGLVLETREMINIKEKIDANISVTISAGKKLYAGNKDVNITYISLNDEQNETSNKNFSLKKNTNISFSEDIKIVSLDSSNLYLEGTAMEKFSGYSQIKSLKGYPLMPDSILRVEGENNNTNSSYIKLKYYDGSVYDLKFKDLIFYTIVDLGTFADTYLVRTNIENDFYYARINAFKDSIESTKSQILLFSPQSESDDIAPELDLDTQIRVPVFKEHRFNLGEYIFEDAGIGNLKEVYVDFDLEYDSDGNGDPKDDNDIEHIIDADGNNFANMTVDKNEYRVYLNIKPFDNLFKKKIRVFISDNNYNKGYSDIDFEVYSPTPEIVSDEAGIVFYGQLDEKIEKEPINLYRYRGGEISKLEEKSKVDTVFTTKSGSYVFGVENNPGLDISIKKGGVDIKIGEINEKTGKIDMIDPNSNIKVYPSGTASNDLAYPKIVVEKDGNDLYYQYIVSPNIGKVNKVSSFGEVADDDYGVFFTLSDNTNYNYYILPDDLDYNPGALILYRLNDSTKMPIIYIHRDGRVISPSEVYSLSYDTYDSKYVVYVISRGGSELGRVMIKTEENYIMK